MKDQILDIMHAIVENELKIQHSTCMNQRALINQVFSYKGIKHRDSIILRLTVLDSLYSTNASYSYFSLEEIAEKIHKLGTDDEARDFFNNILLDKKISTEIFSKKYGIRKNLAIGSQYMSLVSKYAYYIIGQDVNHYPLGFPIYDRLAKEAYPTICKMLRIQPVNELLVHGTPTIEQYIKGIKKLKEELFNDNELFDEFQQYDVLDAYLWRMGKFSNGNLSLLLSKDEYIQFVRNFNLDIPQQTTEDYNSKMKKIFKTEPPIFTKTSKGDRFNFNEAVICSLRDPQRKPFQQVNREKYLNQLLGHWRLFDNIANNK